MQAFFSEIYYDGTVAHDFIEVAVSSGTDTTGWSVVYYKEDGTVQTSYDLGSTASTIAGKDVYIIDQGTAGFTDIGATKG